MRQIEWSKNIKRDFKKLQSSQHRDAVNSELPKVLELLVADNDLPPQYRDHALYGDMDGYRECHLRPDLLLIYELVDEDILRLARLGSHSELLE